MKNRQKQPDKKRLTLRVRMIITVQLELLLCTGLAFLIDQIGKTLIKNWSVPTILEVIIVTLITGSIATFFTSKMFFNPIKKLQTAMEKVANGDFTVRLDTNKYTSGEIRELYNGFNMMIKELSATEVLQSDFVSNVSHEIKTPINAIEGYSTLLQGCNKLNPEQQEYIEKILFNTHRLSSLVSNILLLSKIENQSIPSKKQPYSLDEQIREAILDLEPDWTAKNIEFDVELDDAVYNGNENLMRHVWSNLISNAIKFSDFGQTVKIRLCNHGDSFVFTVTDQGVGISDEAKKHLFDKFYQADTSHKSEGNGLGLALVKRILTIFGGEITAENVETGGCKFTVTLYNL